MAPRITESMSTLSNLQVGEPGKPLWYNAVQVQRPKNQGADSANASLSQKPCLRSGKVDSLTSSRETYWRSSSGASNRCLNCKQNLGK